jgi:nitrogen fixation NifU-like protein
MSDTSISELWEHVDAPSHRGQLVDVTHSGLAVNSLCGDEVQIQLRLGAERQIQQAAFIGRGCAVSQGAASLVCERVEGLDVAAAMMLTANEVLSWMGVALSPIRQRCALLAYEALTKAISAQADEPVRLTILDRQGGRGAAGAEAASRRPRRLGDPEEPTPTRPGER